MATASGQSAASFLFLAAKAEGGRRFGVRTASNERALADSLRAERMLLLRAFPLPAWASPDAGVISLKDQSTLSDVLGQLLTRGVPLVESLDVAEKTVPASLRTRVRSVRERVSAGESFAEAAKKAGLLDHVTAAVYRAAERSGDLGGAAKQVAHAARRQLSVRGKAATVMIYPALVLSLTLVIGLAMLTLIVPRILGNIAEMGTDLNWFSRAVYWLGVTLRDNWFVIPTTLVAAAVGVVVLRKPIARAIGWIARRTPMLKSLLLAQESARFFAVMSALSRSGVPLADGLGIARHVIGHPTLRDQLARVQSRLVEGGSLPVLIEQANALPPATRRLLVAAERSGELDTAFDTLAQDMAEHSERQTQRLLAALEPVVILMMFAIIGTLVLSIMIPVITSIGQAMGR